MRIDPETGQVFERKPEEGGVVASAAPSSPSFDHKLLLKGAMEGTLPLPRPLRSDEVERFGAIHVCMVMDMAQGMRNFEIQAKYSVGDNMVCNLRCHPWTQMILQALFSRLADNLVDPVERIKAYANEAIDVKVEILRDTKKPASLRNVVASDLLDRAGFGARTKVQLELPEKMKPSVPSTHLPRIAAALEAAASVREADFSRFVVKEKPQEAEDGLVAVKEASSEDSASSGDSGASHAGPPHPLPISLEKKKLTPEEKELQEEQDAERNLPPGVRLSRVA